MVNRLAAALSPYLRQHAENPVDWWEWSPEAFEEAVRRDVPLLLSVGYAACHWCHVMAHESFEDHGIAQLINDNFVAIKVDREERPDVDATYMAVTQAMTGRGGWPMTCLLTPDGIPFYAGTYFPRHQFGQLLAAATDAWRTRRDDVVATGSDIVTQLASMLAPPSSDAIGPDTLDAAAARLATQFDDAHGGFGGAPKFPPTMVLEFLLRHHARTGSDDALAMATQTAEAMARGGIYDQLGGGFARYSVDPAWVVPHFEKMLYDNAQLLRFYAHLHRATGSPLARRVAAETADFLLRDLRTPEGLFASALDADTDGVEGLTYVWSRAQLADVLGEADGAGAADALGVTPDGTFEHGTSTLQLLDDPDPEWWSAIRTRLFAARARRPQPARDDKAVTAWNGLAIAALADAGVALARQDLIDAATTSADALMVRHVVDGRLRRTSLGTQVSSALAGADDYGNLAEGLLALHQATSDPRWLAQSGQLLDEATRLFHRDAEWHDTATDAEQLVLAPRNDTDNAEPSGRSALAGAFLTHGALTGAEASHAHALELLASVGSVARQAPRFAGWALAVAEAAAAGPLQVAIVGSGPGADALIACARSSDSPGMVVAVGQPDAPGQHLLEGRPLVHGQPAAYVCRGFVCELPVTTAADLAHTLARHLD